MMNRLRNPRAAATMPSTLSPSSPQVEAASYTSMRTKTDQPVTIFAPVHYEPNYAYPLVVWMHGPGNDEHQLKRIMPLVSLRNYVGVAVRGTTQCAAASGKAGFSWAQSEPHTALATQRVLEAITFVQGNYNVSTRRVFLAGFDCGGTMALRLALAHPRWFAGVLSLGGEFPVGGAPLSRLDEARRVPIFLACGRTSERYPSAVVCDNLKLLHSAGMDLTLREYPGGQEISEAMLADMDRWMMELVTGARPSPRYGER
jgi:phospholipase/carboxylesterase